MCRLPSLGHEVSYGPAVLKRHHHWHHSESIGFCALHFLPEPLFFRRQQQYYESHTSIRRHQYAEYSFSCYNYTPRRICVSDTFELLCSITKYFAWNKPGEQVIALFARYKAYLSIKFVNNTGCIDSQSTQYHFIAWQKPSCFFSRFHTYSACSGVFYVLCPDALQPHSCCRPPHPGFLRWSVFIRFIYKWC